MSKKGSTMKRKFSFDIPRLKIGQSKTDKNFPTDAYANASGIDSPPQTPKSVRPPLTPRTDHELRLACTYVLQNFKPSHQIYEEQYGKTREERSGPDYFTSKQPAYAADDNDNDDDAAPPPVVRTIVRKQIGRAQIEQDLDSVVGAGNLKSKQTLGSENLVNHGDHTRIKSQTIELLERASVVSPEPVESKTVRAPSRNGSIPLQRNSSTSNNNNVDHLSNVPRSGSADTNVSTPQTEEGGIEYPWTTSTAPTSVGVTPARNSVRASQVRLSGSENGSKFLAADTEWMMQELDKHKRAQAEAKAQQELEEQVLASIATPTQARCTAPPNTQVRRKPVPRSSTDGTRPDSKIMPPVAPMNTRQSSDVGQMENDRIPPIPVLDSRQSADISRSQSRKRRSTPRSESRHENTLRPESRGSRRGRQAEEDFLPQSRASSRAHDFKLFFMPGSLQTPGIESEAISRSPSRSRSITRRLQDFVRPSSGAVSPNGSAAESRPDSRARSIESSRSDVSALAPSVASSTKKWRNWKPFHRNQSSNTSLEASRPPTTHTNSSKHRRTPSGDNHQSQKPAINLNRELPPLPSLDHWQTMDYLEPPAVETEKPKHIVQMASPPRERVRRDKVSFREDAKEPRDDSAEPPVVPRRPGGLKLSTSVRRSSKQSNSSRNSMQTSKSAHSPVVPSDMSFSALLEPFDDLTHVSSYDPASLPTSPMAKEEKKERRRSKRPPNMSEPNLHEPLNDMPASRSKPHVVNFSRTPSNPGTAALYRKTIRQSYVPTPSSSETPATHERRPSDQINFSRKPSSDDYARGHEMRFPNVVEIKSAPRVVAAPTTPAPAKDKAGKKKWWQPGKTPKKEESWMDQVVKSGSRSGMILTDAGAPIVRY